MNQETARYLIHHFPHLLTAAESAIQRHVISAEKLADMPDEGQRERWRMVYERQGWLLTDQHLLSRLAGGPDAFFLDTARRIYQEHGGEELLNNCPRCGRLARTPRARQCRQCGHAWRGQ